MKRGVLADKCNRGGERRCPACDRWFPRTEEFFNRRPDGRWNSPCKDCHRVAMCRSRSNRKVGASVGY